MSDDIPLFDLVSGGDERFRTIGEAAAETGIKPHILRYWEENFALLRPLKRAGGRRYYRRADIDLIRCIDDLINRQGYTFAGAKAVLSAEPMATAEAGAAIQNDAGTTLPPHVRAQLLALRGELADLLAELQAAP